MWNGVAAFMAAGMTLSVWGMHADERLYWHQTESILSESPSPTQMSGTLVGMVNACIGYNRCTERPMKLAGWGGIMATEMGELAQVARLTWSTIRDRATRFCQIAPATWLAAQHAQRCAALRGAESAAGVIAAAASMQRDFLHGFGNDFEPLLAIIGELNSRILIQTKTLAALVV